MTTESRAIKFLAGTGPAVFPKKHLYEASAELYKLKRAIEAGYTSAREHELAKRMETEKFYKEVLGCKT